MPGGDARVDYRPMNTPDHVAGRSARGTTVRQVILVTGGAGFIGAHIVDALAAAGEDVRVLDRASGRRIDGVEYVRADIRDRNALCGALDGVTAVCHQAAKVGLEAGPEDAADYVADNDLGTATLLSALAERRFRGRLVLASSMVVYGEGSYACPQHGSVRPAPRSEEHLRAGRFDPTCPECSRPLEPRAIGEDAMLDPRNVYAATKLHQEHLCFVFGRQAGVPVTALRYHNVYGPGLPRGTRYAGVAAIFLDALVSGRSPRVTEDGHQLRDFVHVRDVARANLLALTAEDPTSGAFNVCSGDPRSVGDVASALHAAFGERAPAPQVTGEFRPGDVRHVFADAARAAQRLGFRAREEFSAGMAELAVTTT
jgi:dTDP-L-rhamnose 4-epimerase